MPLPHDGLLDFGSSCPHVPGASLGNSKRAKGVRLMKEVTGGMRLALRHWRELAGTTLIFALVCFALSFILGDVIVEVGVLRGGATVRREGATTFACFYLPLRPVSNTSPRLLDMLAEKIEEGRAYSSVIGNLEADSPEDRSEEHTSELQSHYDLVCRLLLEKKKKSS